MRRCGTDNEPNAVAALVSYVLPSLFPDLTFCEEGLYNIIVTIMALKGKRF